MEFDIISYIDDLAKTAEKLSPKGRIAFATWCAEALVSDVSDFLAAKVNHSQYLAIQKALDHLWSCILGDDMPFDDSINQLERDCGAIGWNDRNVCDDEQAKNIYAIQAINCLMQALEVCRTRSAQSVGAAAECVINKLDRQLCEELDTDSYSELIFSTEKMQAELRCQRQMLHFLETYSFLEPFPKRLFRE